MTRPPWPVDPRAPEPPETPALHDDGSAYAADGYSVTRLSTEPGPLPRARYRVRKVVGPLAVDVEIDERGCRFVLDVFRRAHAHGVALLTSGTRSHGKG